MTLRLGIREVEQIHAHLNRAYPEEGCGVLLGRDRGSVRHVERVEAVENRREGSRGNRYLIAPEQLLAVEKQGRQSGLDVVGFFHSHPDHPPDPSGFDLDQAWPYYSYLIVSVMHGKVADARAWRLAADRSRFEPEPLEATGAAAPQGAEPKGHGDIG